MAGDKLDFYLNTLRKFTSDACERIDGLINMLAAGDIMAYTIGVHALKGASAGIGADKLAEQAAALEEAARAEDIGYILRNNDDFLNHLQELLNELTAHLEREDESGAGLEKNRAAEHSPGPQPGGSIELLKSSLEQLKAGLTSLDAGAVEASLDALRQGGWNKEIRRRLENISEMVLLYEYDRATEIIDELLGIEADFA